MYILGSVYRILNAILVSFTDDQLLAESFIHDCVFSNFTFYLLQVQIRTILLI